MPVEIEPQVWEWRRLETTDGYDALLGMINARLRSGPTIRRLSPEQELRLARMCVTKNKSALAACLEEYLQIQLGLGVDDSTLDDPRYLSVTNEACLFIFFHSDPTTRDSRQFRDFLKTYAQGRPYSLPLVKSAWKAFEEKAEEHARQLAAVPQVTAEDLANLTDEDIQKALTAVSREHADAERRRRDLLHYDSRQEYRRAEDVIKELHNIE